MPNLSLRLLRGPVPLALLLVVEATFGQVPRDIAVAADARSHEVAYELAWLEQPVSRTSNASQIELTQYQTTPAPAEIAGSQQLAAEYGVPLANCPTDELRHGLYVFYGYDSWRGIQDDSWGNNGAHAGVNYGTRLGPVSDWTRIGFQVGGSVGVYNWSGTDYHLDHVNEPTVQGFLTYGFFRTADCDTNWSAAVVQDWMFTSNYGIFGENPTLAQWRGKIGYAISPWNEFGLWGTVRSQGDKRDVPIFGSTTWRPVDQLNVYWQHKWGCGGADTWIWFGVPERDRLAGGGSLGDYIAGATANVPLSDRLMLYNQVTYMHPSAGAGPDGSTDEAWSFVIGLSFYPAANTHTSTLSERTWMPQLPVANNGVFLVDTNQTY